MLNTPYRGFVVRIFKAARRLPLKGVMAFLLRRASSAHSMAINRYRHTHLNEMYKKRGNNLVF